MADAPPPPPPPPPLTLLPPPLSLSQNPNFQSQLLTLILTHHSSSLQSAPHSPVPSHSPEPLQTPPYFRIISLRKRPPIRVTSEFNSDGGIFLHKVSSKLFDGLAKLKFSFQNNVGGRMANPQLSLFSKFVTINYDLGNQNAFLQGILGFGNFLITAVHNVKVRQGEVTMMANLSEPGYRLTLASSVPCFDLPKVTLKFPCGEVSLQEKVDDEEKRVLSISGIVIGPVLHGGCTAFYKDGSLNIRYSYKDEEMSFIPCISVPSNALSFAFKRYFCPSDKLSYWYNFENNYWSTVYKHKVGKNCKFKAGYDSKIRLGWASFWIGDKQGRLKTMPMKMKIQFVLEVPQDDVKSPVLMFRVKKRWDI